MVDNIIQKKTGQMNQFDIIERVFDFSQERDLWNFRGVCCCWLEICDWLLKKSDYLGAVWYKTHLLLSKLAEGACNVKLTKREKGSSHFESSIGVEFEIYHYYNHSKFINVVDLVLFDYTGVQVKRQLFTFPCNHKIDSFVFLRTKNKKKGVYVAIKIYKGRWVQTKLYLFFIQFSDFSFYETPDNIYQTLFKDDKMVQLPYVNKSTNTFKLINNNQPLCYLVCKMLNNESNVPTFHITLSGAIFLKSGNQIIHSQTFPKFIRVFHTNSDSVKYLLDFGTCVFLLKYDGNNYVTLPIIFEEKNQFVEFCQSSQQFVLGVQTLNNGAKLSNIIDF